MISQHFIWVYLWVAPHVLLIAVAAVMFWRRRHRDFPVFFAYLLFEILQFCVLFAMGRVASVSVSTYREVDLLGRAGSIAFRFAIIQEILELSVAHSPSLRRTTAWMLKCATVFLALLAALFIGAAYSWNLSEMIFPVYAVKHTLNIVQCSLLALVFLWYRFLHLKMQHFVIGIVLGMGLVAGLDPLLDALKDFQTLNPQAVDLLQMGAYHVSVLIWLGFAMVQEEFTSSADVASVLNARKVAVELGRLTWR
jgi:hypothetical protein